MTRPAYVPIPDTDADIDSPGAEDFFQALRDNIAAARVNHVYMDVAQQDTSGVGSYETLWSFFLKLPPIAAEPLISPEIIGFVRAKVSANNGDFRLRDSASGNAGTPINVTSTSLVTINPTLALDTAWYGSIRTIQVQAQQNVAGIASGQAEDSNATTYDY